MIWVCSIVILILLAILFLIYPGRRAVPFESGMRFAHRGLFGGGVPENSLSAFRRAAEAGLAVEFDVHLTTDDRLIVFHDDDLVRMCGIEGKTDALSFAEAKKLRLAGTDEEIPSLEEVLAVLDGKIPFLLEIKQSTVGRNRETCRAVADALSSCRQPYLIESFHPSIVREMRRLLPDVCCGQLSGGIKNVSHGPIGAILGSLLSCLCFDCVSRPDFIAYNVKNTKNVFFRFVRSLGVPCYLWTIRDRQDHETAARFDGEIFETYD